MKASRQEHRDGLPQGSPGLKNRSGKAGRERCRKMSEWFSWERPVQKQSMNQEKRWVVSAAGFEPATHALKGHCSTN